MCSNCSRAIVLLLALLMIVGCSSKPASTGTSGEDGEVAATAAGSKSKKNPLPIKRNVKEIAGNWVVVVTNSQVDNYRWLVSFTRGTDGKTTAQIIDTVAEKNPTPKPEIIETNVDGDAVRLVFESSQGKFNFEGTLQQGFIRGTIVSNPFEIFLARLLPTDEKSLASFAPSALPPGGDVFQGKLKSNDVQPEDMLNTIHEYRNSPLAQDMYTLIIANYGQAGFSEEKLIEVIRDFLSTARIWGQRWEARMEISIAANLINGRKYARLAPAYLDESEKKLGDEASAFQQMLNDYRTAAKTKIRIQDLLNPSSSDELRAAAYSDLTKLLEKQRFNPEILLALADEDQRVGRIDDAIRYLSDLVTIPMLEGMVLQQRAGQPPDTPTPSELLKTLWVKKHGNDDGLREHESQVYQARMDEFLNDIRKTVPEVPADDAGNKTLLVELFTGISCPPCVGADLALSALGRTFPTSKVAILRFHQHIPSPDGLVNQDSEERGHFYELPGTPFVCVDGNAVDARFYAGAINVAWNAYGVFRRIIDPRVSSKTEVTLNLTAQVTDGQLTLSAEATGIPEDQLASCRLRMAIVENNVETYGPLMTNGIRDHEYVVREMPGGAKGIPPKKGELKFSQTVPIAEVQQHVIDYIKRFEAGRRGEFPAELKPPIRGPLSFVAWVQNGNPQEKTGAKLVLQSAMIPVSGETGFGPGTTAEKKQPSDVNGDLKSTASVVENTGKSGSTPPPPALPE